MPRGSSDIPTLRLERLNKLVTSFMSPVQMVLSNLFGSDNEASDTIKWESQTGNRGMTPFVSPGSAAPSHAPTGVAEHQAKAAYWKEKMYCDEEFLNNLRKEGTESTYLTASKRLARELFTLRNRCDRRKEWMFAKMLSAGEFDYLGTGGLKLSVDYDLQSDHIETLTTDYKWEAGTKRNIMDDVQDGKIKIHDDTNGFVDYALCNSTVLKFMSNDDTFQTLLMKSAYGRGDLFTKQGTTIINANAKAIGNLLDIPNLIIYDEKFVVERYLTAALAAAGTTVYVGDTADYEAGTATLVDVSAGTSEDVTISSVNTESGTLTISASTYAYKAGEDKLVQTLPFLPNDKFIMFASQVDGQKIAEFKASPFGLSRNYGMKTKKWDTDDPEGTYIMVENKGLPVLYNRDAMYIIDVN